MGVSQKFRAAVKLSSRRAYVIAQQAGLDPSVLSRILNGIDVVKPGDPRVLRVAAVLGLRNDECFDDDMTRRMKLSESESSSLAPVK